MKTLYIHLFSLFIHDPVVTNNLMASINDRLSRFVQVHVHVYAFICTYMYIVQSLHQRQEIYEQYLFNTKVRLGDNKNLEGALVGNTYQVIQ